jgi:neutral ceramidase
MRKLFVFLLWAAALPAASFKAGAGRADITPAGPIWMSGYAARTHPSDGVAERLWARALAIESGPGRRVVIVSTDVVGIPRSITDEVFARLHRRFGLERSQFLINASHTHTGPIVWGNLPNIAVVPPAEQEKLVAYGKKFTDDVESAAAAAIGALAPATLDYGEGSVGFAINRRQPTPQGIKGGVNPDGPVDHSVPVIKIVGADGKLRAVLFGYACHNTTLTAEIYQLSGDYAGFAAAELEKRHEGATAVFLELCGADQNPNPRGTVELGRKHGDELAAEVERVMASPGKTLTGPIRTAFLLTPLKLAPRTREDLVAEQHDPLPAKARRAGMILAALDAGKKIDTVEYPVQAIRFGRSLTLVALGGEVVVDYALRVKREHPGEPIVVVGYSNGVMSYIPSRRVLREGGYEANDSMIYYGLAGPYADDVEDRIFAAIGRVLKQVGR